MTEREIVSAERLIEILNFELSQREECAGCTFHGVLKKLDEPYADGGNWNFAWGACTASLLWFSALGFGARMLLPMFRAPHAWRVFDVLVALLMFGLATLLLARPLA